MQHYYSNYYNNAALLLGIISKSSAFQLTVVSIQLAAAAASVLLSPDSRLLLQKVLVHFRRGDRQTQGETETHGQRQRSRQATDSDWQKYPMRKGTEREMETARHTERQAIQTEADIQSHTTAAEAGTRKKRQREAAYWQLPSLLFILIGRRRCCDELPLDCRSSGCLEARGRQTLLHPSKTDSILGLAVVHLQTLPLQLLLVCMHACVHALILSPPKTGGRQTKAESHRRCPYTRVCCGASIIARVYLSALGACVSRQQSVHACMHAYTALVLRIQPSCTYTPTSRAHAGAAVVMSPRGRHCRLRLRCRCLCLYLSLCPSVSVCLCLSLSLCLLHRSWTLSQLARSVPGGCLLPLLPLHLQD